MADSAQQPLKQTSGPGRRQDPEVLAAKLRLRQLAADSDAASLIREHPWSAVGAAFMVGMLTADKRRLRPILRIAHWWLSR